MLPSVQLAIFDAILKIRLSVIFRYMQNIIQIYENKMGVVAVYMIHNFLHHRFSCKTCPLTFCFIFAFISIPKKKYDLLFIHVLIDIFSSMVFLQTGNLYFVYLINILSSKHYIFFPVFLIHREEKTEKESTFCLHFVATIIIKQIFSAFSFF